MTTALKKNTESIGEIQSVLGVMNTSMHVLAAKLETSLKTTASNDPLLSETIYWLALDKAAVPTNEDGFNMHFLGIGFEAYFNPLFPSFFQCTFIDENKKRIVTPGTVIVAKKEVVYYAIQCPSPAQVQKRATFTASLTYQDGEGVKSIPFKGTKGRNQVLFSMIWTMAKFVDKKVILDVSGLDLGAKYVCEYTDAINSKIKKITDAAFLDGSRYKLSCGQTPSGFRIQTGKTTSTVTLKVSLKGTSNELMYAGPTSTTLLLPTCANGIKDGVETDTDCGGICTQKCGAQKACKKASDCALGQCQGGKCGGGPGTESSPGDSCKQIKRDYKQNKNGRYWITGVGKQKVAKFKVFCWMVDRVGGGWTLINTGWYSSNRGGGSCIGPNDCGSVDHSGLLGIKTKPYKLSDTKIKAVIGQPAGQSSQFDIMGDQSGWNNHYGSGNYEYVVWQFSCWAARVVSCTCNC